MGTGSQASRSVARVVLLDGTFAVIPPMLAEGRRVMANIERVAGLFVTRTVYAAGLVPLFAVPASRRVLALQLPPAGMLAAVASVVLAAIVALTLWRRASRASPVPSS
jgi:magnesium-transporting ATPase (P-type)